MTALAFARDALATALGFATLRMQPTVFLEAHTSRNGSTARGTAPSQASQKNLQLGTLVSGGVDLWEEMGAKTHEQLSVSAADVSRDLIVVKTI